MARKIRRVSIGGIGITFVVSWPGKPGFTQIESRFHGSQTMVESYGMYRKVNGGGHFLHPQLISCETWWGNLGNLDEFAEFC